LRVGRALDNDLVLSDPHVALHHLRIEPAEQGLALQVGETVNGVQSGRQRLRSGARQTLAEYGVPAEWVVGRTHLRLRLPGHTPGPELPMVVPAMRSRHIGPLLIVLGLLLAALSFGTWLESDPDTFARTLGSMVLTSLVGGAIWCGLWSMLSKIFTRQTHFGWHLTVVALASLAWIAAGMLPELVAFALSWPWLSDFGFVGTYAIGAAALYFHLLAVEPARPRLLRGVAVAALALGVGLSLWFNHQRSDRLGAELYMSHLFPPAARLAPPVAVEHFVDGLAALQPGLDKKAMEPPQGDSTSGGADVDE
jgi:hypothetical protein